MVNKLVSIIVFILMILGVVIYFRVEFKYTMVLNGRGTLLINQFKKNNASGEMIVQVLEKNGVEFAQDYNIAESYLYKTCDPNCLDQADFYKNNIKLLNLIIPKRFWVVKQNRTKDNMSYYIEDREEGALIKNFTKRREFISGHYEKIKTVENKTLALELIKVIDSKIAELKKK